MNRTCGSCSLCCKLMAVPDVTPANAWCTHCAPGHGGCRIYGTRPEPCREFACMWLIDAKFADYWYPRHSRIVIDMKLQVGRPGVLSFIVDPAYPKRWTHEPWFSDIKALAKAGMEGRGGVRWSTVIMIGDEKIPIVRERALRLEPAPPPGRESSPSRHAGPAATTGTRTPTG